MTSAQRLNNFGIGASEISAVIGMNPFASPWDIWLRKTGQAPDVEETAPMEWGHRLEPAIRKAYVDKSQLVVVVPSTSVYRTDVRWARATPDGVAFKSEPANDIATAIEHAATGEVVVASGADRIVQIKNVGYWVEKAWSDAPPVYVQLQEAWEMYVTGTQRADVAVLIGGNDFRVYTIHRDDRMIADLVEIAGDFWRKVETRTPPTIDDSDACKKHFERRYTKSTNVEMVADSYLEEDMREWRRLHVGAKQLKKNLETVQNRVRSALADAQADRIVSSIGTAFLINPEPRPETNWQAVAEMLGTRHPEDFADLVEANSTIVTPSRALYPPRVWSKDKI